MFGLGPMEIVVIGIVMLLLFGKRLPQVARDLGKSVISFKRGLKEIDVRDDVRGAIEAPAPSHGHQQGEQHL